MLIFNRSLVKPVLLLSLLFPGLPAGLWPCVSF